MEALEAGGRIRHTVAQPAPPSEPAVRLSPASEPWRFGATVPFRALERYEECGQRFKYEWVYGLRDEEKGYLQFHTCVWTVMTWAAAAARMGAPPDADRMVAELKARWEEIGPTGHRFERGYRRHAERVLRAFAGRLRPGIRLALREEVLVSVGDRTVSITVDEVEEDGTGHVYRRYHLGPPARTHKEKDHRPALIKAGHAQRHGDIPSDVRLHYPLHGGDLPGEPTSKVVGNRMSKMAAHIAAIEAGHFRPKPSRNCLACPFVFICPG